jgi:hypothetical protein
MEYEEYLKLDRTVYYNNKKTGIRVSVAPDEYYMYGEEFELLCQVLESVVAGDSDAYNSFMGDKSLKKTSFTQQQIYDIEISPYSTQILTTKEGISYTECVFEVRYKIHENNGSFRRDIESDACRPQYFVINDSTGTLLLMDIINRAAEKD